MAKTESDHGVLGRAQSEAWLGFLRSHSVVTKALDGELVAKHRGRRRVRAAQSTHLEEVNALFLDRLSQSDLEWLAEIWRRVLEPRGAE